MSRALEGPPSPQDEPIWFRTPPGRPFYTAVSIVVLISFYGVSVPRWYTEAQVFMFLSFLLLAPYWLIRLSVASRSARSSMTGMWSRHWLPGPLIFLGVLGTLYADAPFWIRFTLSEPGLEQHAKTLAEGARGPGCRWVGLYNVCDGNGGAGEAIPGGARFLVEDAYITPSRGFVWLPAGRPPMVEEDDSNTYSHLSGPWWAWKAWDGW